MKIKINFSSSFSYLYQSCVCNYGYKDSFSSVCYTKIYSVTNIKFRQLDLRSDGPTMVPMKKTLL
jgi:hypothetical protein